MKRVQKILFRPYPIILGLLALFLLVGASLLPKTASASLNGAPTLSGAYACTTTFNTGPTAGQTEQATLTFNTNGTMSVNVAASGMTGQGYWWTVSVEGNNEINYSFRELLPPGLVPGATDVQVVHLVTNIVGTGRSFTSQGHGLIYDNATALLTVQTTSQCTLQ